MDEKQRQHLESQLSAYLDNELSERERQEVEAFLHQYGEARDLLAELRATIQVVQKLPRARASEQLIERLRARMERDALLGHTHKELGEVIGRTEYAFGWRWIAAAAVIALTFVTAYLMGPFSRPSASKHDQFAYRDEKPVKPSVMREAVHEEPAEVDSPSELRLGKRKTEEIVKEDAARPIPPAVADAGAQMSQSENLSPPTAAHAARPAVDLLADSSKDESRISDAAPLTKMRAVASVPVAVDKGYAIELAFADRASRGRYLESLNSKANGEGWVLQAVVDDAERKENESAAEASLHFELTVPGEAEHKRILDEAVAQVHLSLASQPGERAELAPAEQQASTSAPGGSLLANKAVAVAPQTKPGDSAGAAYLLRLRVKTAGAALASQPTGATLPASGPS